MLSKTTKKHAQEAIASASPLTITSVVLPAEKYVISSNIKP